MKTFEFTVTDANGIHARPAGNLSKLAKTFKSTITIEKDGKKTDLTKLIAVMGMAVKKGNTVTVTAEGEDEEVACNAIQEFFNKNL